MGTQSFQEKLQNCLLSTTAAAFQMENTIRTDHTKALLCTQCSYMKTPWKKKMCHHLLIYSVLESCKLLPPQPSAEHSRLRDAETFNLGQFLSFCFPILSFTAEARGWATKSLLFYSEDYMGIRRLQVQRLAAECSLTSLLGKLSPTQPVSSVGGNRQITAMASSGKVNWLKSRPGSWTQGQSGVQVNLNLSQIKPPELLLTSVTIFLSLFYSEN